MTILGTIRQLIEELNNNDVRYCHWKSNLALAESLSGQTDIDLLVHREDARLFRTILSQNCFRPAVNRGGEFFPSMEHYFALDEESGRLVHVHAYLRIITGESLTKNYHFPVEEMLLQNTRQVDSVRVPVKGAELVIFVLRMMLKHTSLVELVMLARYREKVNVEIEWLLEPGSLDQALSLIDHWLPSLDAGLFADCVAALKSPAPLYRRVMLAHKLRFQLRIYARHAALWAWLIGIQKFSIMSFRRLTRSQKGMIPLSGGAVIAFVGPEASGKSTLMTEMRGWLGEHFAVQQIHAGKPKSTLLSIFPNSLVPALRFALPGYRSSRVAAQYAPEAHEEIRQRVYPLSFAVRSVLLAYDRLALLTRAFGRAANGTIVLCDRYPSVCGGTPDSPQLLHLYVDPDQYPLRHMLARLEERLYERIPPPDLVISLRVPLEVAILRNQARSKTEPEDYLRMRHAQSAHLQFEKTRVYQIDTNRPLDETVSEIKRAVWNAL